MHIYVLEEIQNGARMMKYVQNHWWKFKYPGYAWLSGFLQVISMYTIEIANIFVVMSAPNIIEIVKDLMALTIISEIDDLFAMALGNCLTKDICSGGPYGDLFTIEVTTSKDAIDLSEDKIANRPLDECQIHNEVLKNMKKYAKDAKVEWNEITEKELKLNRPTKIRIDYWPRSLQNKAFLAIYRLIRFINVTIWIYFLPTLALIAQFVIPMISEYKRQQSLEAKNEATEALRQS